MIGVGLSIPEVAVRRVTVVYDTDAQAAFAAMTVPPDATLKRQISDYIAALKVAGTWAKRDWRSLAAVHDSQAALINLRSPAQVATLGGLLGVTPAFTADRGFSGIVASASYIDLGIADNGGGTNSQNSSGMAAYVNALPAVTATVMGLSTSPNSRILLNPTTSRNYRIHGTTAAITTSQVPVKGLYAVNRTSASALAAYLNGAADGSSATATSAATVSDTVRLLAGGGQFSDARIAAWSYGGPLTALEEADEYTAMLAFLTARGAN